MSLGTWLLSAYSAPLTALAAMSLLPGTAGNAVLEAVRVVLLVVGVVIAVGAAGYKGVLFSTTAQRGWGEARWFGGYLVNSAIVLGATELLLLAWGMGRPDAGIPLRLALVPLLLLNLLALALLLASVRGTISEAYGSRGLPILIALGVVGGILVPAALLTLGPGPQLIAAVLLMLLGATAVRHMIVQLPHLLAEPHARRPAPAPAAPSR